MFDSSVTTIPEANILRTGSRIFKKHSAPKNRRHQENSRLFHLASQKTGEEKNKIINKAVEKNLPLVHKITSGLKYLPLPYEDMVSEGSIGLIKAAERFDPDKDTSFATYARFWIKQALYRAAENQGRNVRISAYTLQKARKLRNSIDENYTPDNEEKKLLALSGSNTVPIEGVNENLLQSDGHLDDMHLKERRSLIMRVVSGLEPRKRIIVEMYFGFDTGEPETHSKISEKIGLSRERVRQLQHEAVSELRHKMRKYKENIF